MTHQPIQKIPGIRCRIFHPNLISRFHTCSMKLNLLRDLMELCAPQTSSDTTETYNCNTGEDLIVPERNLPPQTQKENYLRPWSRSHRRALGQIPRHHLWDVPSSGIQLNYRNAQLGQYFSWVKRRPTLDFNPCSAGIFFIASG